MKKQTFKSSLLTVFLLVLLVAALAISMISCDKEGSETEAPEISSETTVDTTAGTTGDTTAETTAETTAAPTETEVGEGQTSFTFKVKFKDGSERTYLVKTNKTNLGEALIDAGLIAGEDGPYGLYVKTVAGETLDYDKDKKYWALYENDGYAMSGVDTTTINTDVVYSFVAAS
ncbi:MAG: hypothetical protein IKL59_06270 [Clostridia bacterium]|nr:hypothetical protein [Clostridia bacterium]